MTDRPYIFLDPAGREDLGLLLLVLAPTGVEYENQVAGYLTEQRSAEGFLIPLGLRDLEEGLADFFETEFKGHSYHPVAVWTEERLSKLGELVGKIPVWRTSRGGEDEQAFLALDLSRMDELTEAWVPVLSSYGPGILLFKNCD